MLFLAQTDTTAGFLSKDEREINRAKKRALNTPCILTTAFLSELLAFVRVPKAHKNLVRKARKTSFIYPNKKACRVVNSGKHAEFLREFGYFFSSSANLHGRAFDAQIAREIILEKGGKIIDEKLFSGAPSRILRLGKKQIRKIR